MNKFLRQYGRIVFCILLIVLLVFGFKEVKRTFLVGVGNPENSCRGYRKITQVEKKCGKDGLLNFEGIQNWYDTFYYLTYPKGDPEHPIELEGIYCMRKNDNGYVRYWIHFPQQGETLDSYMEKKNIKPTPKREQIEVTTASGETIKCYYFIKPNQQPSSSTYLFFEYGGCYYNMRAGDTLDQAKEYCALLLSTATATNS